MIQLAKAHTQLAKSHIQPVGTACRHYTSAYGSLEGRVVTSYNRWPGGRGDPIVVTVTPLSYSTRPKLTLHARTHTHARRSWEERTATALSLWYGDSSSPGGCWLLILITSNLASHRSASSLNPDFTSLWISLPIWRRWLWLDFQIYKRFGPVPVFSNCHENGKLKAL